MNIPKEMNKKALVTFEVTGTSNIEEVIEILRECYDFECEEFDTAEDIPVTITRHDTGLEIYYSKEFGNYPFTYAEVAFTQNKITMNTKKLY